MNEKYDVLVVGMGPSAIFTAYELTQLNSNKRILLIDQGKKVENRFCPLEEKKQCIKCKPFCNITSGFSGAGAFSDGKLSLYNPEDDEIHVGGNIHKYIGVPETKKHYLITLFYLFYHLWHVFTLNCWYIYYFKF